MPAFVLDRRLLVLGAQPNEVFEQAFAQLEDGMKVVDEIVDGVRVDRGGARCDAPRTPSQSTGASGSSTSSTIRSSRRACGSSASRRRSCSCSTGTTATAPPSRQRLGVPHHVVPRELPETPFELRPVVRFRWWNEVALWWEERRLLLVADALGTVPFFCAGDEPAGVHPVLRPWPPRSLRGLEPEHLLVGHGDGIHHQPAALESALRTARRRIPRWLLEPAARASAAAY